MAHLEQAIHNRSVAQLDHVRLNSTFEAYDYLYPVIPKPTAEGQISTMERTRKELLE